MTSVRLPINLVLGSAIVFVLFAQPLGSAGQPLAVPGDHEAEIPDRADWNETYLPLMQHGEYIAGNSLAGVVELRGFNFTDDLGVNELLSAISTLPKPSTDSVTILISHDVSIAQYRTHQEFDVDWKLSVSAKISFDEANLRFKGWDITIVIDASCIELDSVQIPFGLEVAYESELTRFIDFHAQRNTEVELQIKKEVPPATFDLFRKPHGGGLFE